MLAIIADVHGNWPALEAVFERIDALGIGETISLGDVAGYYCMINECIDEMRRRGVRNLMGNHDHYLVSGESCGRSRSANACLDHQRRLIRDDNRQWLAASQNGVYRHGELSMVHGGWNDPVDEYVATVGPNRFAGLDGSAFLSGHTHVQGIWPLGGGRVYCNPGSVGQPRDGDPRAAFATWDGQDLQLHRVPYDVEKICHAMASAGFDEHYFANLRQGTRIGGAISRVQFAEDAAGQPS